MVTGIRYALPASSHARLTVFDLVGREVATLVDEVQTAGEHAVEFDAAHLASGTFFYRLQAGSFIGTKKMQVLR